MHRSRNGKVSVALVTTNGYFDDHDEYCSRKIEVGKYFGYFIGIIRIASPCIKVSNENITFVRGPALVHMK